MDIKTKAFYYAMVVAYVEDSRNIDGKVVR